MPRGSCFNCIHCGAALTCNPTFTTVVAMFVGGIPAAVGSAFGDLGITLGLVASVVLTFALWRAFFTVRRDDGAV